MNQPQNRNSRELAAKFTAEDLEPWPMVLQELSGQP